MDKNKFKEILKQNPFTSYSDLIYDGLFNEIITMQLLPGTRINTSHIANELEISRSPVQAAINKLIDEYLVTKEEHKYPYVSPITSEDSLQMTEARIFIESYAGYLAAPKIKPEYLERLKQLAGKYEEIVNTPHTKGFETCDHAFHTCIIEASENTYLIQMYETLQNRILRYRYYLRHRLGDEKLQYVLKKSSRSHWIICNGLEMGLARAVQDELTRHNDSMRNVFSRW